MGPGLIVMVGDNDAGGVATYAQTGQNGSLTALQSACQPNASCVCALARRMSKTSGWGKCRGSWLADAPTGA